MSGAHAFLQALTTVLAVAAVTTVVFQWLRQPVVLGYILAGLIVGPHVPIPLIVEQDVVETLSELGVILLMFALGLEFTLGKLWRVGSTAGLIAVIETSFMAWLGFMAGQALGWTTLESLFGGAFVCISSTTVIAKAFGEQGIKGKLRELVLGVLIVEDLIAILLMTLLTALATGGVSIDTLALSSGRLALFLAGLLSVGMLVVPPLMRAIVRLKRPETTLVASIGLCFGIALLTHAFGYSVALGAFIAGSLVAESGEEKQVEHLIMPVRDMFAAIFFVSVGMLIDPAVLLEHWVAVGTLTLVVILGKLIGVSVGSFLSGNGTRHSVQAGMSLAQIGEFSFIIAGLGVSLKATGSFLYPVAVAVSALTTLSTPWLIRAAGPVANAVDRKLPKPIQTFVGLYGSWVEALRARAPQVSVSAARRSFKRLLLDAALLAAVIIGTALTRVSIAEWVSLTFGLPGAFARPVVTGVGLALGAPFLLGIVRLSRRLGLELATTALPQSPAGRVDLAAAPRRALVVTVQLGIVLAFGLPLLALTQPFLPLWVAAASVGLLLLVLGVVFWKSAMNLHGHVRAGAEIIAETLRKQAGKRNRGGDRDALDEIKHLLPGLGELTPLRLGADSPTVGKTLAELNLRGVTGVSVLAIARDGQGVIAPTASEMLRAGDVLALSGSQDAVVAARELLGVSAVASPLATTPKRRATDR